nr:polysaccharide biosynthesis tyrosine autokinase [Caballeronia calidae]
MNSPFIDARLSSRAGNSDGGSSLRDTLFLMRDHVWTLLACVVGAAALAAAYAFLATPIYSADAIVRVDPTDLNALGISSQTNTVQQQQQQSGHQATAAEIAVMQSRSVLEPVIGRFGFDVEVKPHTFPILGRVAELLAKQGHPSSPWLGLDSFAWGGEKLRVGSLYVPPTLEEKPLELTVLDKGSYELRGPDGEIMLRGIVGTQAKSAEGVSITINEIVARPGTQFKVVHHNTFDAIETMRRQIRVAEVTKDTGIVQISFTSSHPILTADVANALAEQYIATAVKRQQLNDTNTLEFIRQELPRLGADLRRSEEALSSYQSSSQSLHPTAEAQAYLQGSIELQQRLASLQLQRTQLMQLFTANSPQVQNIDKQLAQLQKASSAFDTRFGRMPTSERRSAELTRDAKVAEAIYLSMVNKAEELSVRRASTSGGAQIVDKALRQYKPIKPNRLLIIGAGGGLGFLGGMLLIFLRRHVMTGVTDPFFVERRLSVPVIGEVLFSQKQAQLDQEIATTTMRHVSPRSSAGSTSLIKSGELRDSHRNPQLEGPSVTPEIVRERARLLALRFPNEPAVEALRAVRTEVCEELAQRRINIAMLTGPSPSAGKSFVAANLAVLLAEIRLRVLLIDADMRRGNLASFFRQSNPGGLADVLGGTMHVSDAIRSVGVPGLSFMSCGSYPSNPSELLMMPECKKTLNELSEQFDVVLVDTPPILVLTDAAIIARQAGATILVLRSGMQSEDEISDTVRKLQRAGGNLLGSVFNAIPMRSSNWRSYGYPSEYMRTIQ